MHHPGIFKAYDIRGVVPLAFDEEFARKLAAAFAEMVLAEGETTHIVADAQMRKTTLPEKYMKAFREAVGK